MPFRFGLSKVVPWLPFKMERFLVLSYSHKEVLLHNNTEKKLPSGEATDPL